MTLALVVLLAGCGSVEAPTGASVAAAETAVAAMRKAGVDVRFDVLEHHDHDVWSDTYADPAFYEGLLSS